MSQQLQNELTYCGGRAQILIEDALIRNIRVIDVVLTTQWHFVADKADEWKNEFSLWPVSTVSTGPEKSQ